MHKADAATFSNFRLQKKLTVKRYIRARCPAIELARQRQLSWMNFAAAEGLQHVDKRDARKSSR